MSIYRQTNQLLMLSFHVDQYGKEETYFSAHRPVFERQKSFNGCTRHHVLAKFRSLFSFMKKNRLNFHSKSVMETDKNNSK